MRGMLHVNDDANRTWHSLATHIASLASFERVDFPLCPSSVLHTVTEKLTSLRQLVAESVVENVSEPQ